MGEPTSEKHYEDTFQFPLWKLIKKRAEEKDMPVVASQYECSHCGICWMECPKRTIEIALPASFY